jgi:ribA/ribD-fused uncharacterized protein
VIAFRKVREAYGWLSNMSPHPVQGFRTAEALFQSLRFDDKDVIAAIRAEKSPMAAKMVAKKHADKFVVVPRSEQDLDIMRAVLRAKVLQHPDLLKALLETGDELIVEDCTARQNDSGLFWGAGRQSDGSWLGKNVLGVLWMRLRTALREEGHPL